MAKFDIDELSEVHSFVVTKQALWLTADRTELVAEGDERAAFLFASAGKRVSKEDAERYGLMKTERAAGDGRPAKSASRAEWDEHAKGLGIDPEEHASKEALIEAVEAHG